MAGAKLDDIDRKILAELTRNARIPVAELARKVGLSKTPVALRIRQLEEKMLLLARDLEFEAAAEARDYLLRRGLNRGAEDRFEIGFAPDSRTALTGALRDKGFDDALIVATTSGDGDDDSYENSRAAARSLAQTELENTIDVPVILRKNQGEEVSVMVARDLDFSGVYRLK